MNEDYFLESDYEDKNGGTDPYEDMYTIRNDWREEDKFYLEEEIP